MPVETIRCQGHLSHRLDIDASNKAVALDHDEDAERIVAALGGAVPTCMTIVRAFADPTAVTLPNDPRFVAYCADPRFVSDRGMEQVRMRIEFGGSMGNQQDAMRLQRTLLLEAEPALRMRWLVRWLDVVEAAPAADVFHASAEFVAYRIAGVAGTQVTLSGLQRTVLAAWERGGGEGPDWSVVADVA